MTLTAAATLALGIGALTGAMTIADAALWRPLPFRDADRLVVLVAKVREAGGGERLARWSYERLQRVRAAARTVESVASVSPLAVALTGTDRTEPLAGEVVSPEYFRALNVVARVGRVFSAEEDRVVGAQPVVVVSHALWQRRFGGEASVVGRSLALNGVTLTITGVMPPGFTGLSGNAEFWLPTAMAPRIDYDGYRTTDQLFIPAIARLAPGRTLSEARAELAALGRAVAQAVPSGDDELSSATVGEALPLGAARVTPGRRRAAYLLIGAVALLHLLACANAASLLLGWAVARTRESAIRAALGGSRLALVRQALAEGATVTWIGALGALLVAAAVVRFAPDGVASSDRVSYLPMATFAEPAADARLLLWWGLVTVLTVAFVGWVPAVGRTGRDVAAALRRVSAAARATGMSLRRPGARGVIVAVEAALAVALLVVAMVMLESYRRLRSAPIGVDASDVLTFRTNPSSRHVPTSRAAEHVSQMLAAIQSVPGVERATVDGGAPLSGSASAILRVAGRAPAVAGDEVVVLRHYVGPQHFAALGIPVLRGRAFTDADRAGAPKVVVISASAARRHWPQGDALGARVWFDGGSAFNHPDSSAEVIGIVGDVAYDPLDRLTTMESFYTPYAQFTYASRTYFVRTSGDPSQLVPSIRDAVHQADPEVALLGVQPLSALLEGSRAGARQGASIYGAFGVVALLLAASGIGAVVAHAVRQRRREMAIRLAVGAAPGALLRLVLREGMALPAVGMAVGVMAALGAGGALRRMVYGVSPADPVLVALALGLLAAAALLACLAPARAAMRVPPHDVLRD